jgi:pyruvate/2-oxoglutarate dehydrogenase complex dihydrolipoamide dehydrogenase (E3) component
VDDFDIIRDNLAGGNRSTRNRLIPYCMYTDPPLARVGLNEDEALQRGIAVGVAKLPMSDVLRTRTIDEAQGFMKALIGAHDDRILGFTMIGPEAGEVMATVQTAILAGCRIRVFAMRSSRTRQWRKGSGSFFRMCLLRPPSDCCLARASFRSP